MNPLLNESSEKDFDTKLELLDKAGYQWDGALATAPDGYVFSGLVNLPFYLQVYKVWDYFMWKQKQLRDG